MVKGLAVISGSDTVVFKALENGNITLGANMAANVVISGSLKLEISGYGADKFLMSDASGSASWVTIQASQVAMSDGSNVQAAIDALEASSSADIDALEARISSEEVARADGDALLTGRISTEESVRESVDASLSLDLSAEEVARTDADAALESRISTEESVRESVDASLSLELSAEESRAKSVELHLEGLINDSGTGGLSAAKSYTDSKVADLVDGAPELLDTLNELAAAINDDPNYATTITTQLGALNTRISAEEVARADADAALESRISTEESVRESVDADLEARLDAEVSAIIDNTITFQGTANEVEIVSGGVVTLGDSSSTVVLGLPDDVIVNSSLNVTGDTTLGVGPIDDQLTINSKMRITHVLRTAHASVLAEYADTAALAAGDFDGHMFYLKGEDAASGMFQQGNKWYFCENGVWHSSFFYVGS